MISINPYIILFQMINFCILVWLLNRFVIGPLNAFLEKRENGIKKAIQEAESNQEESQKCLEEQKSTLKAAQQEAKSIRQTAEDAAKREQESIITKAQDDAKRLVDNAHTEINNHVANTKKELTKEVGKLAIDLSSKLVHKNLDEAAESAIINDYVGKNNA